MKCQAFGVDLEDRTQLLIAFPRLMIMAGVLTAKAGDTLIFEEFGLNVAKYGVLRTINEAGGQLSMTSLKEHSKMTRSPSNFTQMVDDLEAKGLVRRIACCEDRRISLVEITDEGRALSERVLVRYWQVMEKFTRSFPTQELRDAVYALIKWIWEIGDDAGIGHLKPTAEPFQD